jgi:hypothetical protein
MEINNTYLVNVNDSSTLSSSVNIKALENAKTFQLSNSSFTLDMDISLRRSDFANQLKDSLNNLAINQQKIQYINKQEKILDTIQNDVMQLQSSTNFEVSQETIQPKIEASINEYNTNIDYRTEFTQFQETTQSQSYFDGLLGAKPLSPSDIRKAVEEQMQYLKQINSEASQNIEKTERKALKTIGDEIEKVIARAPYEPVDFGKNTTDFTSTNINSIVGSVVSAQANAIPAHSQKLLS